MCTKENPRISIIVPVYNVDKYLSQCLDSILAQTYSDFEVLLVDDGSTDGSGTICDNFALKDSRLKVFHKANGGVSSARNLGLDNARGEWVVFVDSDDWLSEIYCETLIKSCINADITFFSEVWHYLDGCKIVYSSGEIYTKDSIEKKEDLILHLLQNKTKHNYFGYTWNKIFKRKIIEANKIRFVEGLSTSEDEVFTLHFSLYANSMKVIYAPIYHYRVTQTGLTAKNSPVNEIVLLDDCLRFLVKRLNSKVLIAYYEKKMARKLVSTFAHSKKIKGKLDAYNIIYSHCKNQGISFVRLCMKRVSELFVALIGKIR